MKKLLGLLILMAGVGVSLLMLGGTDKSLAAVIFRRRIISPSPVGNACRVMNNMYPDCDIDSMPDDASPRTICGTGPYLSVYEGPDGWWRALSYYKDKDGKKFIDYRTVKRDANGKVTVDQGGCAYY